VNERTYIRKVLKQTSIRLNKKLGQTFLIDDGIAEKIVESAHIKKDDVCLEIGAGFGVLTQKIARRAKKVIAVEIDRRIFEILKKRLKCSQNLTLLNDDILKLGLEEIFQKYGKVKIVSNLPYSITTPVIAYLIRNREFIDGCILTMQKEVAERLVARPGTKAYGALTVKVKYFIETHPLFYIPKDRFLPSPEVDSATVNLEFLDKPRVSVICEDLFFKVIDLSFQQRRKMLKNCIFISKKDASQLPIDLRRRGETLSVEEFAKLANGLTKIGITFL